MQERKRGDGVRPALAPGAWVMELSHNRNGSVRWYAVQCLSNREFVAAAQLENQGFHVFLPLREKTRRHARRFERVRRPLFPGYAFVRLDLSRDRWRSVNGTLGVVRLVSQADRPLAAPKGAIETIRAMCDANGVMSAGSQLLVGETVRVTFGPFADLVGRLEHLNAAGRVSVLLELMGRRLSVALARDHIAPALAAA